MKFANTPTDFDPLFLDCISLLYCFLVNEKNPISNHKRIQYLFTDTDCVWLKASQLRTVVISRIEQDID